MSLFSRSTTRPLRVLVVEDEESVAGALCSVLRRRGHEVSLARSVAEALALDLPEVLVTDVRLGDGNGFELVAALTERGPRPSLVFLSGLPSFGDCRRALALGAADFLPKPFPLDDLVRAVERPPHKVGSTDAADVPASAHPSLTAAFALRDDAARNGAREIAAFALRHGVGPASRARIASACAEILANAVQHSGAGADSEIVLSAEFDSEDPCRDTAPVELLVRITDAGHGFDAVAGWVESAPSLFPSAGSARSHGSPTSPVSAESKGLVRAAALSEDMRVESHGRGTTVTLRFTCSPSVFDAADLGHDLQDFSEVEYLAGATARAVLDAVEQQDPSSCEMVGMSPALAVTVGRLLAGRTPSQIAQAALWS